MAHRADKPSQSRGRRTARALPERGMSRLAIDARRRGGHIGRTPGRAWAHRRMPGRAWLRALTWSQGQHRSSGRWLPRLLGRLGNSDYVIGEAGPEAVGWYSPDGTAWEAPQPLDTSPQLGTERPLATCWTGNSAVVVGSVTSTSPGSLPAAWVSSDGSSWTNASFSPPPVEWIHDHSRMAACLLATGSSLTAGPRAPPRSNEPVLWSSSDGTVWQQLSASFSQPGGGAARRVGSGTPRRHRNRDYDLVGLERGRRPSLSEMAGTGRRVRRTPSPRWLAFGLRVMRATPGNSWIPPCHPSRERRTRRPTLPHTSTSSRSLRAPWTVVWQSGWVNRQHR